MGEKSTEVSDWLYNGVEALAASPQSIAAHVANLTLVYQREAGIPPNRKLPRHLRRHLAERLVESYADTAAWVGAVTAIPGWFPGIGTILAVVGGGATDAVVCMKYEVDMVRAISYLYGRDISSDEAKRASMVIAGLGTLNETAKEAGKTVGTKAAIRLVRQHLKGAILQFVKAVFKKVGLIFTRKGLEKAIPGGVGTVIGYKANQLLTRRLGNYAIDFFEQELAGVDDSETVDGRWIFEEDEPAK